MNIRYLLSSCFGAMLGASCVLGLFQVTTHQSLPVAENISFHNDDAVEARIESLHSRINDFYIFAGIVITPLLAINVGVFVKADQEVQQHLNENFTVTRTRIEQIEEECENILRDLHSKTNESD